MIWSAGKQLKDGKYTVKKLLYHGGFGITYLAEDKDQSRKIVIKTPNEKLEYQLEFAKIKKNFLKEAEILAKFQHPHIVQIYGTFQENQVYCIAMEYIAGDNLYQIVTREGALSEARALRYIRQIGDALITMHQYGLLHRDINPRNIVLRAGTSKAVLIDFGMAREFIPEHSTEQLTISQGYSPPEQYSRHSIMAPSSDVYSLAATLYFLLTKVTPISAIDRIMGNDLIPPNELNLSIHGCITQAILDGMSLKAESRPQSMQEWLKLLKVQPDKDVTSSVQNSASKKSKNKVLQVKKSNSLGRSLTSVFIAIVSFIFKSLLFIFIFTYIVNIFRVILTYIFKIFRKR